MPSSAAARPTLAFDKRLVLNQFMLGLLGAPDFGTLATPLRDPALEYLDENGVSLIHHALVENLPRGAALTARELLAYDENIVHHTRTINDRRGEAIRWKYFQYLALLFTEIYLDRYFRKPEQLLADLNSHVAHYNTGKIAADQVQTYGQASDLTKLAYWMATGAGKTLLMHVNILQYQHYLERLGSQRDLNRIVLLTPSEGLSRQHLDEFTKSGMQAELFSKEGRGLYAGRSVEIIDINKLKEEGKEKTVSVDAFEGNNLVLVDEGHRGAGGETWMDMRNRLAEKGFSFEYSATFGQAMKTSNKPELVQEYARAILFDYSYKYFYGDGYGKDYRILNLQDDSDEDIRSLYLTAGLLSFYQQLRLYADKRIEFHPYLLDKPLWIFVGASVNAVRSVNRREVSDVVDILLFFARFAQPDRKAETIRVIDRFLRGESGLLDAKGRELFPLAAFDHLVRLDLSAEAVYADIFQRLFNAGGPGTLHLEDIKGAEGEIAVRLGGGEPFGVINVGDTAKLRRLCEQQPELVVQDSEFGGTLFQRLDDAGSTVNLLIGSKKFTEGWSSWRVSCMGLMNLGRSEGTQIIQLFGRGVRLRGYQFGLKRSSRVPNVDHPRGVRLLETLNIFGVRADYMAQFREYLEDEGVPTTENTTTILLPVIIPPIDRRLLALKVKDGLDFKRQGPIPTLTAEPPSHLREHKVVVDWYPRVEARQAKEIDRSLAAVTTRDKDELKAEHIALLDLDAIYFQLVRYKNERSWYNLNLSRTAVAGLLGRCDWYTLYIPHDELAFASLTKVPRWQEVALALLKKYVERFYKYSRDAWERPHLQLAPVVEITGNFSFEEMEGETGYRAEVPADAETIAEKLRQLRQAIHDRTLDPVKFQNFASIFFDRHLYQPLIWIGKASVIRVTPQALNDGEQRFVEDLRTYYDRNRQDFAQRELYLLRNQSRGRGLGFFEAGNFYPDFILWLLDADRQYVTFVDPKGIRNLQGLDDPKIRFRQTVKDIETRIGDPNVILNSFVISNTPRSEVEWWNGGLTLEQFAENNVLFQTEDQNYVGKMLGKITS